MKLNKRSRLLLTTSFVATSILGTLAIVHIAAQIFCGLKIAGEKYENVIGIMDTNTLWYNSDSAEELAPIVIIEGSDTEPQILAEPTEVLLYSNAESFEMPKHWGLTAWRMQYYLRAILLVAMVVMLLYFAFATLRGSRSENLFTKCNLNIIYALVPTSFIYLLVSDNVYTFMQYAISELYSDKASIALHGAITVNAETFIVPLLLIMVAQLYKVAITMNEDDAMTI